ncbi:MAG: PRD domain-containing protein [Lachnospiraceae bacterium]|nr:PRD domain-containing protein [Lachnospiraceae bacterium]
MPQIKKVLNSSVILVSDEQEKEYIILQKGIGYGRKPGEKVELSEESQIFVPLSSTDRNQFLELLKEIPAAYLELSQKIVAYAENQLHTKLNEHIYLALTDHLHFAVERFKEKVVITNRVFWELKTFYPKEYQIGLYALDIVREKLGIDLPEEEAANVAFHIVNAQKDEDVQYDAMRAAKLIGKIVTLVTYLMKCQPDKESIHYSRFISHLQYFAERFFSDRMLDSPDDFLYEQIEKGYPKALNCAERVRTLVLKEYDKAITNEEVVYLAVHIQRLISRD